MSSRPTGGSLLSQALAHGGGATSPTLLGNVGPSDKFFESGMSPAAFASQMRAVPSVPEDDKGVNKASDDVLNKSSREIQGDPFKVKVSVLLKAGFLKRAASTPVKKYLLDEYMRSGEWGGSGHSELMPKDMTQADRIELPGHFLRSGFDEDSGTTSPSVADAATKHDQGPDAGADSYETFTQEKDMKDALRRLRINQKTAALLRKLGIGSPPVVPGEGSSVPNDGLDLNTEPDLKRMTDGASEGKATFYPRHNRPRNLPDGASVKQAIDFSFGAHQGGYSSGTSSPSTAGQSKKQPVQKPPKPVDTKRKQPRRVGIHAEFARTQTDPFQGPKIPQGFPADDPKAVEAKTAELIKRTFRCP